MSRQADQFDWIGAYLKDRGLQPLWRRATFASTVAQAAQPIIMMATPFGPDHAVTRAAAVGSSVVGFAAALLWLVRWPTRRQSIAYSMAASAAIAATCLAMSNPYSGLLGCATFAILGGFIAYFHTTGLVLTNVTVAAVCVAVLAYRLIASTGDVALTCASLLTVTALNVGIPFGIQSLVHVLRADLRSAERDPLTGLYNRRSLYTAVYQLLRTARQLPGGHLVVVVIDLDRFKQLNDTRGHPVGDEALVAVAAALQANCHPNAVIGRTGGEEFVVFDTDSTAEPAKMAERLRRAIAEIPLPITASLGVCAGSLDAGVDADETQFVDDLIRTADLAMYEAKRAGGDRAHHHPVVVRPDGSHNSLGISPR